VIDTFLIPLLKIVIVLNATLVAVTYMVLLERKVIAWAQSRLGPMRVGPYGILQPVADAIKLMLKEDITPVLADKWVFTAAQVISMVPALIVYAVIPFGPTVSLFLMAGSLSMVSIVRAQESQHLWYAFVQPFAFGIFVSGSLAETNRAPF